MNAKRRNKLAQIALQLDGLRTQLESLRDEEQEAFDNLPDNIKDTDRGEAAAEACEALDNAVSALEDTTDTLSTLAEGA